jgi:hypothetical protein
MTALALATLAALHAASPDASPWPVDLTRGVDAIELSRRRGDEPVRRARAVLRGGVWRVTAPRRGEADPDAVGRLLFVLTSPQLVGSRPSRPAEPPAFDIALGRRGRFHRVTIWPAPLGAPVPLAVDGGDVLLASPVELATKVPDPDDLLPAGLWTSARGRERSLAVAGPTRYALHVDGRGEWAVDGGRSALQQLDDVAGVITGRQVIGSPSLPLARLGLEHPVATATLCVRRERGAGADCRRFRFGAAVVDGRRRTFATGADMDPVELRDDAWRLLVEGPFTRR